MTRILRYLAHFSLMASYEVSSRNIVQLSLFARELIAKAWRAPEGYSVCETNGTRQYNSSRMHLSTTTQTSDGVFRKLGSLICLIHVRKFLPFAHDLGKLWSAQQWLNCLPER